jgi:hypothetical protein
MMRVQLKGLQLKRGIEDGGDQLFLVAPEKVTVDSQARDGGGCGHIKDRLEEKRQIQFHLSLF